MRELSFYFDTALQLDGTVCNHDFVLRCMPQSFPGQELVQASLCLDPAVPYVSQSDCFGNLMQIGRMEAPHDHFQYTVKGLARLDLSCRVREKAHPLFAYPSRYTTPSSHMQAFLERLHLPADPQARAWLLAQAVHAHLTYAAGVTGVQTTAAQAFELGSGVCQDFSHVYLTLARMAGIPARYVNGLPVGEGASHAWCEVWLDGVWTGIDPTRGCWADEGYIRFGVGRDFFDCPMERGVFWGSAAQRQTVFMKVCPQ